MAKCLAAGMSMWERTSMAGQGRLLLYAVAATALVFISVPMMDLMTAPPAPAPTARTLDVVAPPPAVPPPLPRVQPRPVVSVPALLPRLAAAPARAMASGPPLRMDLTMGTVAADFAVNFPVAGPPGSAGTGAGALALPPEDFVFDVAAADAPPRPLARLPPLYPAQARLRRVEGEVNVEFVVTAAGSVIDAVVVSAMPPDLFDQSALQAIRRWRFEPGRKDGQAVAVRVRQKLTYTLEP